MPKTIEVYVKIQEILTNPTYIGQPLGEHYSIYEKTFKKEKTMSEEDTSTLRIAQEVSEEAGLKLRVYDTSTFTGKIRAWLKGIRTTPTILVGESKLEKTPTKEELLSLLK